MTASWRLVAAPWWLLAAGMLVDELYFHMRRGLPRWERLGHPVDTAATGACLAVALWAPPSGAWLRVFAVLAALSALLVTKDEGVHLRLCGAGEARLHAALFMLHPLSLLSALYCWLEPSAALRRALAVQVGLTAAFLLHQLVYWNLACAPAPASTTTSTTA